MRVSIDDLVDGRIKKVGPLAISPVKRISDLLASIWKSGLEARSLSADQLEGLLSWRCC